MTQKYLRAKWLPPQMHLGAIFLYYTALDYWQAPGWVFGVVLSLWGILSLGAFIRFTMSDACDPVIAKEE